jgi:hypothetical protein
MHMAFKISPALERAAQSTNSEPKQLLAAPILKSDENRVCLTLKEGVFNAASEAYDWLPKPALEATA